MIWFPKARVGVTSEVNVEPLGPADLSRAGGDCSYAVTSPLARYHRAPPCRRVLLPAPSNIVMDRMTPKHFVQIALGLLGLAVVVSVLVLWWPAPPFLGSGQGIEVRLAICALVVGVFGAGGIVLTMWAGVREIELIFPKQLLAFEVQSVDTHDGDAVWELRIRNGDSYVSSARVEVRAWGLREKGASWRPLPELQIWDWVRDRGALVGGYTTPWYPGEEIPGPRWRVESGSASAMWRVGWWTDRETRHQHQVTITNVGSKAPFTVPEIAPPVDEGTWSRSP